MFLLQAAIHGLEDRLRFIDTEEQKRDCTRDAEQRLVLNVVKLTIHTLPTLLF